MRPPTKSAGTVADGHQHAVDDECHRRRDQDVRGPRCRRDGGRKGRRIAVAHHGDEHDPSHGGRAGRPRAGYPADDHGHQDGDHRQGSPAASDDGLGEPQQPLRHAGPVEDGACEDEHGDGKERILGDSRVKIGREGHDAQLAHGDGHGSRQAQGNGDGYAGKHHDKEGAEKKGDQNHQSFLLQARIINPAARPQIARDNIGSQTV